MCTVLIAPDMSLWQENIWSFSVRKPSGERRPRGLLQILLFCSPCSMCCSGENKDRSAMTQRRSAYCPLYSSPWYNRTGWLGVKHQLTYLLTFVLHCISIVDVIQVSCPNGGAGWGCRGQQSGFSVSPTVSHEEDYSDFVVFVVFASFIQTMKRVARVLRGSSVSTAQRTQTGDEHLYSNSARFVQLSQWQFSYACDSSLSLEHLYSNSACFVHVPRWQLSYALFWRLEV